MSLTTNDSDSSDETEEDIELASERPTTSAGLIVPRQFHQDLIMYAKENSRLFFIENTNTWCNFFVNRKLNPSFNDYSPTELATEFVQGILPNLSRYNLPIKDKKKFELLKVHPNFKRSADGHGFELISRQRQLQTCRQLRPNEDYKFIGQNQAVNFRSDLKNSSCNRKFIFSSNRPSQTLVLPNMSQFQTQRHGRNFQFSKGNAALLLALTSKIPLMPKRLVFDPQKIHRYFVKLRIDFLKRGNFRMRRVKTAIKMLEKSRRLREAYVAILDNKFKFK